jgi:pyruvate/2-oxoglutarate dehydrogenase complex dihydrolipoamide acyltransferase (E2) component
MMYMSLSFDHRILDGLIAARFLGAVKRRLESWGPELDVY